MNTQPIEYGGAGLRLTPEQIAVKLRNAPRWVRERAAVASQARPAAPASVQPPAPASRNLWREIGWVAGTCCPGVSSAAHAAKDGRSLPEQFTDAAWRSMLEQVQARTNPVRLTWGHGGPTIATTEDRGLSFRVSDPVGVLIGLEFHARLPDSELGQRVLAAAADGLGVSIGYHSARQWIIDRDGVGEVRVVDDCVLDHVAVLPPSSTLRACYTGARCFAGRGPWVACPKVLQERAQLAAYAVVKQQAGA